MVSDRALQKKNELKLKELTERERDCDRGRQKWYEKLALIIISINHNDNNVNARLVFFTYVTRDMHKHSDWISCIELRVTIFLNPMFRCLITAARPVK